MNRKRIKVRKEVVRCAGCKRPKDFLYLSDFAYGQKLIFINGATEYAFINLMEDKVFAEYRNIVSEILRENAIDINAEVLNKFINESYDITCDKINGHIVDFSQKQKKCYYCGSTEFERNMIEPESLIEIDVPVVSHNNWEALAEEEKKQLVIKEFKKVYENIRKSNTISRT